MTDTQESEFNDSDIKEDIARRIRHWREQAQMKPVELAKRLNVSRGAVSRWEAEDATPSITTVYHIASVCGVSLAIFLTADIPVPPEA